MATAQSGYIFLTRNTDKVGNDSPGYWNHCAIISSRLTVVEAQEEPGQVIEVTLQSFVDRYPEYLLYYSDFSKGMGRFAPQTLGKKYGKYALFGTYNCVTVIQYCYEKASRQNVGWRTPDDVQAFGKKHWDLVQHKKDYQNWVMPKNGWFEGRLR